MENKELSDLSIDRQECLRCGAIWLNGQHYWSGTGKLGDPHDLAGLVCNMVDDKNCINPCKGSTSGVTWVDRWQKLEKLEWPTE